MRKSPLKAPPVEIWKVQTACHSFLRIAYLKIKWMKIIISPTIKVRWFQALAPERGNHQVLLQTEFLTRWIRVNNRAKCKLGDRVAPAEILRMWPTHPPSKDQEDQALQLSVPIVSLCTLVLEEPFKTATLPAVLRHYTKQILSTNLEAETAT